MAPIVEIISGEVWEKFLESLPKDYFAFIFFYTPWAASCPQVEKVIRALAHESKFPDIFWVSVNAEDFSQVSENYGVTAVPSVVVLRGGQVVDRIGGSPLNIRDGLENYLRSVSPGSNDLAQHPNAQCESENPLARLVNAAPIMLFMKGTPSSPQCGFSKQIVSLLREHGIKYGFFNILSDDTIRQNLKTFADWPTYPQLWVKGEFVGGLDIVKEKFSKGYTIFA